MAKGYGGIPYGLGDYGDGASFDLESATALDSESVELVFTGDLIPGDATTLDPATYSIPGLSVTGVIITGANTLTLFTSPQISDVTYTVTIITTIFDTDATPIGVTLATFVGIGAADKFVVSNLDARVQCRGLAILLKWTNPTGTLHNKIVRRTRSWPYDLTDPCDVVYDGDPIEEFEDSGVIEPHTELTAPAVVGATSLTVTDTTGFSPGMKIRVEQLTGEPLHDIVTINTVPTGVSITLTSGLTNPYASGARVSQSSPLLPQTYYYYLVLADDSATPADSDYDITDASRVMGLSIKEWDSIEWLQKNTPDKVLEMDAVAQSAGGGGGDLAKWYEVLACWLNQMRGLMAAAQLLNDDDKAPFPSLAAKNLSLGIEPEGFSYDFSIARRALLSLRFVYKRKGTCPGIVETVRMFTYWDAICAELGLAGCGLGPTSLQTWDGSSEIDSGSGDDTSTTIGTGTFQDTAAAWGIGQFDDGTFVGSIGDIACVDQNTTATDVTFKTPTALTTLTAGAAAGTKTLTVASTSGLYPHGQVEIRKADGSASEIQEIQTVTPSTTIVLKENLINTYASGDELCLEKDTVRREYLGFATSVGQVMTEVQTTAWEDNQWKNYHLLDSNNVKHLITSNTATTLIVDGAAPPAGPAAYSIAFDFTATGSFGTRKPILAYQISNGVITRLYEPVFDRLLIGTRLDPFNRLWDGPGLKLNGAWAPNDVAVYITTPVTVVQGKASSVSGAVLTLDATQPAPGVNALVGMYLNPNQNQEQLFKIVSNTATDVTVDANITSLVSPGQYYYVLKLRDKNRFVRVSERLHTEFTDVDTVPHVLFVMP